jgi:cytochrome c-type biogenesis protein CcmE
MTARNPQLWIAGGHRPPLQLIVLYCQVLLGGNSMKRKQLKFVVGVVVIILTLAYLAYSGFKEGNAYYQTVSELYASKDQAYTRRLKVAGDVVVGSIQHEGKVINFVISQQDEQTKKIMTLPVKYVGTDAPPDTFIDRAQAVVEGQLGHDGIFVANKMQAKCASKYEKESAAGVRKS